MRKMRARVALLAFVLSAVAVLWFTMDYMNRRRIAVCVTQKVYSYRAILSDTGARYLAEVGGDYGRLYLPSTSVDDDRLGHYSWRLANYFTWPTPKPNSKSELDRIVRAIPPAYYPIAGCGPTLGTKVMAVTGKGSGFDPAGLEKANCSHNLLLFCDVEASGTNWAEPGDIDAETFGRRSMPYPRIGNDQIPGFFIAFIDGEIWYMQDGTPLAALVPLMSSGGTGDSGGREALLPFLIKRYVPSPEQIPAWWRDVLLFRSKIVAGQ